MHNDLPDLFALPDGSRAGSAEDWTQICGPRLFEAVQREEYGRIPPDPMRLTATMVRTDDQALGGRAVLREIDVRVECPDSSMAMLLVAPKADGPHPCFVGLNFHGNHRVLADPLIRPPRYRPALNDVADIRDVDVDGERGADSGIWPLEEIVSRGYAVATVCYHDPMPDHIELAAQRLQQFAVGLAPQSGDAPGAVACWAWALSRIIDALAEEPSIDSSRLGLVGHSRNAKAALVAMVSDPRPKVLICSQSGCCGTAPARPIGDSLDKRETLRDINTAFPHWLCPTFKRFTDAPEDISFDQHAMLALCAPRPVLVSNAADDLWANPAGTFEMLRAADPVYRLLRGEGLVARSMPGIDEPPISPLAYYIRAGRHSMTTHDWNAWLGWAETWL